jgi:hypothetical protein
MPQSTHWGESRSDSSASAGGTSFFSILMTSRGMAAHRYGDFRVEDRLTSPKVDVWLGALEDELALAQSCLTDHVGSVVSEGLLVVGVPYPSILAASR